MRLFRRRRPTTGKHALGAAVTGIPSAPRCPSPPASPLPAAASTGAVRAVSLTAPDAGRWLEGASAAAPGLLTEIAALLATGEAWAPGEVAPAIVGTPVSASVPSGGHRARVAEEVGERRATTSPVWCVEVPGVAGVEEAARPPLAVPPPAAPALVAPAPTLATPAASAPAAPTALTPTGPAAFGTVTPAVPTSAAPAAPTLALPAAPARIPAAPDLASSSVRTIAMPTWVAFCAPTEVPDLPTAPPVEAGSLPFDTSEASAPWTYAVLGVAPAPAAGPPSPTAAPPIAAPMAPATSAAVAPPPVDVAVQVAAAAATGPAAAPALVDAPAPSDRSALQAALDDLLPPHGGAELGAPYGVPARVQLGFRDGTSTSLDPDSDQSQALQELARSLTSRD